MSPSTYCPLGSPSLLNGDFYENVARLKDFSWSVLLSSDPTETNTSVVPNDQNLIIAPLAREYKEHTLEVIVGTSAVLLYFFLFALFFYKLAWCLKITRNRVITITVLVVVMLSTLTLLMMLARMCPGIFAIVIVCCALDHTMIVSLCFLHRSFEALQPSFEANKKYRNHTLTVIAVILILLVFFFSPVHRPDQCPTKIDRMYSEVTFWFQICSVFFVMCDVRYICLISPLKELNIIKDKKVVGKLVKKEGFGWIEHMHEVNTEAVQIA